MLGVTAFSVLLSMGPLVYAADLREVEASRTAGEIAVDGVLSEADWQAGEWSSGFTVLDRPDAPAAHQTDFKVLYDDANVYVGVRAEEPEVGKLRATVAERDGKVYSDDCVEVMIDPTGERVEYYHFVVNPLGTLYDAQLRQAGSVRTAEWSCDAEAAAHVGEGEWTVELRVPVVELGLTAASADDWAVNVARERRVAGHELSTFASMTGGFHEPALYATLKLSDADFGEYLWEIKEPYEVRVLPDEDGDLIYSAKTHVKNAGPRFRFIMLRGVLGESEGEWVKDGLDAGQAREYDFRVPVAEQGAQTLRLELVDRREPDVVLAIKSAWVDIQYSPLKITLTKPWYRDSIYATEDLKAIEAEVATGLPDEELEGLRLCAGLYEGTASGLETRPTRRQDAGGRRSGSSAPRERQEATERQGPKALAHIEQAAQAEATIRLPAGKLVVGEYVLRVWLEDKQAQMVLYNAEKAIRKLPKVAHEWRINEDNLLLHNGEPVLPFGWFSIPPEAMAEPGHAYNLMQDYNAQWRSIEENFERLDQVVEAGTHVTIYPYPSAKMMNPASVWGQPLAGEEAQQLRERVRALKGHAGIFAWYMADEPELRPALPERCRSIYETVAGEDPFHPCIMLNDTVAGIHKYRDGGDILMPDPYPCFIRGGFAARPIERVSDFVKAAVEAAAGRKAVFVTPQAFNYGDYGKENQRGPTLVELRNELYQAVVHGAKGFLWYTYSQVSNYPELSIGMPWLSFEVRDLKPAVLAPDDPGITIEVDAPKPEHIHVAARRVGKQVYLFAVNTATEEQRVRLTVSPALKAGELHVVSEQRGVPVADGAAIEDDFDIYATHIYTTDEAVGRRESIEVPLARIADANEARKKPGNLAFEDSGATVTVSSKSRYGSTPDRVLDGITTGMRWQDGTPDELPDWLTVTWPAPVTIGRVVVCTASIADLDVQVPEGDDWRTVAEVLGNAEERAEATWDDPVETTSLRILVTGLMADQKYASIWEVEAYAE